MFSKLIFTIDEQEIEFHSHEMVKIAKNIMEEIKETKEGKVSIPDYKSFNNEIEEKFDKFINAFLSGSFSSTGATLPLVKELFFPPYVECPNTVGKWLFLAHYLAQDYEKEPIKGWWFNVANRLILLKNDKNKKPEEKKKPTFLCQ